MKDISRNFLQAAYVYGGWRLDLIDNFSKELHETIRIEADVLGELVVSVLRREMAVLREQACAQRT